MISILDLDVPCRCGQRHQVPLDLHGQQVMLCKSDGEPMQLTTDHAKFQALVKENVDEQRLFSVVFSIHRAGVPIATGDPKISVQACAECGEVLARGRYWWPPDVLVGEREGFTYLAGLPLFSDREVLCHQRRSH